jgi:hypothetical protein
MTAVRAAAVLAAAAALALLLPGWAAAEWKLSKKGSVVTYDERSLLIDGKRDLFFSGAIHYPRSPPEVHAHLACVYHRPIERIAAAACCC